MSMSGNVDWRAVVSETESLGAVVVGVKAVVSTTCYPLPAFYYPLGLSTIRNLLASPSSLDGLSGRQRGRLDRTAMQIPSALTRAPPNMPSIVYHSIIEHYIVCYIITRIM